MTYNFLDSKNFDKIVDESPLKVLNIILEDF